MILKDKIKLELDKLYGTFESNLELLYKDKIIYEIEYNDFEKRSEWATYNQLILELKNNIYYKAKLNEILYRITDDENPKQVCISILDKISNKNLELDRLYHKIKNF